MTMLFFKGMLERAGKTFCQTLAIALGAGAVDVLSVGWIQALSLSAGAALLSVLTSIGSAPWGDPKTPSLVKETNA
jgi:Putative lactococcus lactis phage r1t holin